MLASRSPQRRAILESLGVAFEIRPTDVVETEEGAHTTAFDPIRQQLYVFLPSSCQAAVYRESVGPADGG